DTLEAIGNMGDERLVDKVIEVAEKFPDNPSIQTAAIHALRAQFGLLRVQQWLKKAMQNGDCDLKENAMNTLRDRISIDFLNGVKGKWPLYHFTAFDEWLEDLFLDGNDTEFECIFSDMEKYFQDKLDPEAKKVLLKYKGIIPRKVEHSSCSYWNDFGGRYNGIQSAGTFLSDNQRYNHNAHCLAHFSVGGSKAIAHLKTGAFAGRHCCACNFKVFAKAYGYGYVYGKYLSIGTVEFYAYKYYSTFELRGYVRVGGKTFLDYRNRCCLNGLVYSRTWTTPSFGWRITVYRIQVFILKIDLGVDIRPYFSFTLRTSLWTSCGIDAYAKPKAHLRISGGVSVSLWLIRGGIDLGVNLNYYIRANAKAAYPNQACAGLYHGYDSQSISVRAWYQRKYLNKHGTWRPWKWSWDWTSRRYLTLASWNVGGVSENKIWYGCVN
ncbi:unnamed protein product, partial [Owenia fusiformis]